MGGKVCYLRFRRLHHPILIPPAAASFKVKGKKNNSFEVTPLNALQMKLCSYEQLTGEMGWDEEGNFWWKDREERVASETLGAEVHRGQHQSSSFPRGQRGSWWAGAGPGLASHGGVLGRHCLSAVTPHCNLQYSAPTELPQRKSYFVTKKPFDLSPLEMTTNPFPASLSLVFCGRSSTPHVLLSGDFRSWAVPQELMTIA